MAYNPFDDVIDQDPAYMAEGGGTGTTNQTVTKTAYNQFGQPILDYEIDPQAGKKLVRDMYGLALGEEDPYAKKKLERELSVALAQKEAGLPVDPNKSFVTSAERQDPVLGPALDKFKFEPMGLGEFGERAMEFLYRDQEKARSKQLRGEELTLGEKIAANPFMAALDAADFPGLIGLATKAGIKFSVKGLQTLKNLQSQGASNQVINQIMTTQFPDDAQKIGLVYYQTNRPPGMETSQIMNAPDVGPTGRVYEKGFQLEGKGPEKIIKYLQDKDNVTTDQIMKDLGVTSHMIYNAVRRYPELKDKIKSRKVGYRAETIREYLKDKENVNIEDMAKDLGYDVKSISTYLSKEGKEFSPQVLTKDKRDFGRGSEFTDTGLKYVFDNAPEGKLFTKKEIYDAYNISRPTLNKFLKKNPDYIENIDPKVLKNKFKESELGSENEEYLRKKIVGGYSNTLGPLSDSDRKFFDGIIRSTRPENFGLDGNDFTVSQWADYVMKDFQDNFATTDWRQTFKKDLDAYKVLEDDRKKANLEMKEYFNKMKKDHPDKLKDLNFRDYQLNIAHDFPLSLVSDRDELVGAGGLAGSGRLSYAKTNLVSHRRLENLLYQNLDEIKQMNLPDNKIPSEYKKLFNYIDQEAKKLGTVIYFKLGDKMQKVGMEKTPSPEALVQSFKTHINQIVNQKKSSDKYTPKKSGKDKETGESKGFTTRKIYLTNKKSKNYFKDIPPGITGEVADLFKKGGPVKMAMGGDPLENLNQQQFASDPATDDDYFAKAVQDKNLYAFNPTNLFKIFNKVPAMLTPKKTMPDTPTGEFTPAIPTVDPGDFPFKSYFLSAVTDPNTPKAARPQDWLNYFKGRGVKESELSDIGITQYFEDVQKFVPGSKVRKEDLVNLFEQSPISNIEIKVKEGDATSEYGRYVGEPKHGGMGNAPIDNQGQNYRNIIINSPKLPGEKEPFFNTTHYPRDPNVLAFARVADYQNTDGQTVAVIQELQSDLLNNLRKEQERVGATVKIIRRKKAELQEQINNYPASNSWYQEQLDRLEQKFPESKLKYIENNDLVRPIDPIFAEKLAPELTKELSDIQDQINKLTLANRDTVVDPDYTNKIVALQEQGMEKFQQLYDLNRQANHDLMFEDFKVMSSTKSDEIRAMGERETYIPTDKKVQTFPRVPFNKGKDWIDLIIKGTIQDAQSKGIDKVAIMPSDIINQRWSKDINSPAADKFKTLYDNISVQQLKEIAKKYTGNKNNLTIEKIVDPSKADKGLTFFNKSPDGEYQVLKQLEVKKEIPINERDDFYDEEIARIARNFEDKSVVYSREIAPGQTMDYYVIPTTKGDVEGYKFVPLGDGDNVDDALLKIEEYNPSAINMYTLTLPEETTKKGPMFLYGKKDGGKISSDGLVSITDIYGDY